MAPWAQPCDPAAPSLTAQQARRVLGVHQGASREEILRAWKRLSLVVHPDKNKNSDAAKDSFVYLTSAKELLIRLAAKETPVPAFAPRPQSPTAPPRKNATPSDSGNGVTVTWQCAACLIDKSTSGAKPCQRRGCCAQAEPEDVCFCGHPLSDHRVSYGLGGPRLICECPGCLCRDFLYHPPECICNCGHGRAGHSSAPPFGCLTEGCRCASFHAPRFTCGCGHLWSLHQTVVTSKVRPQSARTPKSAAQQQRWAQQRCAYLRRKGSSGRWASASTFSTFSASGHSSSTWSTSRPPGPTRPKSAQPGHRRNPNCEPGADWRTGKQRPSSARPSARPSSAGSTRPSSAQPSSTRPSSARAERPSAAPNNHGTSTSSTFTGPQPQPPPPRPQRPHSAGPGGRSPTPQRPHSAGPGGRPPPAPGGNGFQTPRNGSPARPSSAYVRRSPAPGEQSGSQPQRPASASVQRPSSASTQRPASASVQRQSPRPASASCRPSTETQARQAFQEVDPVVVDYDASDASGAAAQCGFCTPDGPVCEGCGIELCQNEGYRCSQCPNSFLCDDCVGLKELVHDDVYHAFVRCSTIESETSTPSPGINPNPPPNPNSAGSFGPRPTPPSAPRSATGQGRPVRPSSGTGHTPRGTQQPRGGNPGIQRSSSVGLGRAPSASVLEEAARTMPQKDSSSSFHETDERGQTRPDSTSHAWSEERGPDSTQTQVPIHAPRQSQPYRGAPRIFAQLDSVSADLERLAFTKEGPGRSPQRPPGPAQLGRGRRVSG